MLQRNLLYTAVTRAARRHRWPEESYGDRREEEADGAKVVEAEGVADPMPELIRAVADKPATAAGGNCLHHSFLTRRHPDDQPSVLSAELLIHPGDSLTLWRVVFRDQIHPILLNLRNSPRQTAAMSKRTAG